MEKINQVKDKLTSILKEKGEENPKVMAVLIIGDWIKTMSFEKVAELHDKKFRLDINNYPIYL